MKEKEELKKNQISVNFDKVAESYAELFVLETNVNRFKIGVVTSKAKKLFLESEIYLSPEQAASLVKMLSKGLEEYETNFGKLRHIGADKIEKNGK